MLREWWKWKLLSHVWVCNPIDYKVHGILQARILEWVAFSFSRASSQPRDGTQISCIAGGLFTSWPTRETHIKYITPPKKKTNIYHPNLKLWCGEICLESSQNLTYVYQREVLNSTGSAKRKNGQTTMKLRVKGNNITFQLIQYPVKTKERERETERERQKIYSRWWYKAIILERISTSVSCYVYLIRTWMRLNKSSNTGW